MNRKYKIVNNEKMYEDVTQLVEEESEDTQRHLEIISEELLKGIFEIRLLLDQVEDYSVFASVSSLPEMQKKIIFFRIFYEKSFKEIGNIMEISEKKAENTYYNAIKKIRKMLGDGKYGF